MDYHVLAGQQDGNAYTIVHHVAVPNVNNRVNVNVRTALVNSGLGGRTVLTEGVGAGHISAEEKALIDAGALFEFVETMHTNPGENAMALRNRIDAQHTAVRARLPSLLTNQLAYYGFARDLP